jgi:uncharacterized protein
MWFAEDPTDGSLYVRTPEGTGKLKRIKHTRSVEVAASNPRGVAIGPTVPGVIEVLEDPSLQRRAVTALRARNGLLGRAIELVMRARRKRWIYLRIRPAAAAGTPG